MSEPSEETIDAMNASMMETDHSNFITVSQGMGCFFATQYWWNTEEDFLKPGEGFWEPWDTEPYRWATQALAIISAKSWAAGEGIRYVDPKPVV